MSMHHHPISQPSMAGPINKTAHHALSQQDEMESHLQVANSTGDMKYFGRTAITQQMVTTKTYKKSEDRKYSSDAKFEITTSLSKMYEKETDIQSEYWKGKKIHIKK